MWVFLLQRKLAKIVASSSQQLENKPVALDSFHSKTTKESYVKPDNSIAKLSTSHNEVSLVQTNQNKKRKKRNKKPNLPGMYVRKPFTVVPVSKDTTVNDILDKDTIRSKEKLNGTNKVKKYSENFKNVVKSKKTESNTPTDTESKKFKLSNATTTKTDQWLDKPDELLLKLGSRQLESQIKTEEREILQFQDTGVKTKAEIMRYKAKLKMVLNSGLARSPIKAGGNKLRERMLEKLKGKQHCQQIFFC